MKSIFSLVFALGLLAALGTSTAAFANSSAITLQFEAKIDLGKLYQPYQSALVNPADYDIPSSVTHGYTLRTTYVIPKFLKGQVQTRQEQIGGGSPCMGCPPSPSQTIDVYELVFSDPQMNVTWQLFDDLSGTKVAEATEPLPLFVNADATGSFSGAVSFDDICQAFLCDISLPVSDNSSVQLSYDPSSTNSQLNSNQAILSRTADGQYVLEDIRFDPSALKPELQDGFHLKGLVVGNPNTNDPGYTSVPSTR